MLGHHNGDAVGIEVQSSTVNVEREENADDPDGQPMHKRIAAESPYKAKFKSILTTYDDERMWWVAVENLMKNESDDFAAKVAAKLQVEGMESRQQAIIEVMVDLLLSMEEITVHQGLIYVLDELESYAREFLASELLKRGANLETNDNYGCTPLLNAVKYGAPESIVDILLKHGANVHAVSEDGKTVLHFAAQRDNEVMMRKLIERNLSPTVNAEDIHGRTPLHDAAYCGSEAAAMVLTEKGASVHVRDHWKQTSLHVAAMEGHRRFIKFLLQKKADTNVIDFNGNTPLDIAAERNHKDATDTLLENLTPSTKDKSVKRDLEMAMKADTCIEDDLVAEKIRQMSRLGVINLFKSKKCGGEGKYQFLHRFAANPQLKKSTKAILDHFVVGKRHGLVMCEIIDADENGIPPNDHNFDRNSPSLLDVIVEKDNKELAEHTSIKVMMDHKWEAFAKRFYSYSLRWYAARMVLFGLALLIAARPDLDNPGCYRETWDGLRGICEIFSLIFFSYKFIEEIWLLNRLRRLYFINRKYVQLPTVILPLLIIPFRATTTWCASTGGGYCVDPTLLPDTSNASNFTLDINQACITASSIQWIVASLAYMSNALLVLDYLVLYRTTGVYLLIVRRIIVEDMLKFTIIFLITLYIFVGSFYLALRAGVTVNMSTGDIASDVERFSLQTLYPWHVVFTGLRSLIESREILDGNYFANDDDGQYIGYQWFSIVMYLAFVIAVIVVLLNVLIAQMSNSYSEIQQDVDSEFTIARARIIAKALKANTFYFKTNWKDTYESCIYTDFPNDKLKHDEQEERVREKAAIHLVEQKVDRLTEIVAKLSMRMQGGEESGSVQGIATS